MVVQGRDSMGSHAKEPHMIWGHNSMLDVVFLIS